MADGGTETTPIILSPPDLGVLILVSLNTANTTSM